MLLLATKCLTSTLIIKQGLANQSTNYFIVDRDQFNINEKVCIYPTHQPRVGCDTMSILKQR